MNDVENIISFGKYRNTTVGGNTMTTVRNNRLFPFRLWLLTAMIVGPVFLGWEVLCTIPVISADLCIIFLFIPFGIAFSLPTFMVVWLTHASSRLENY